MKKVILYCLFFYWSLGEANLYKHQEKLSKSIEPQKFHLFETDYAKISGSAQIALNNLSFFSLDSFHDRVIIIDLRREFHGFSEGNPISWMLESDAYAPNSFQYNFDIPRLLLEDNEKEFLKRQETLSEHELLLNSKLPIQYIRIPVTDHHHPEANEVDFFVELVKTLSKSDWIHLHCAGGKGRTTTFMCIVDMIYHSHLLSAKEIIQRQYAIGGSNLFDIKDIPSQERFTFLCLFHQYCLANAQSPENWSSWIQRQKN